MVAVSSLYDKTSFYAQLGMELWLCGVRGEPRTYAIAPENPVIYDAALNCIILFPDRTTFPAGNNEVRPVLSGINRAAGPGNSLLPDGRYIKASAKIKMRSSGCCQRLPDFLS